MTDVTASTKKLKVLFALIGSLGDCLPFLALAKALSNPQGGFHQWDVVVSAHPEFEDLVATKHGFTFAPISQSMVRMLKDTPEGLALRNVGMFNAVAVAKNFFTPLLRTWYVSTTTRTHIHMFFVIGRAEDVKAAHDLHKPDLVVLATFPAMCCLGSIGSTPYRIVCCLLVTLVAQRGHRSHHPHRARVPHERVCAADDERWLHHVAALPQHHVLEPGHGRSGEHDACNEPPPTHHHPLKGSLLFQ